MRSAFGPTRLGFSILFQIIFALLFLGSSAAMPADGLRYGNRQWPATAIRSVSSPNSALFIDVNKENVRSTSKPLRLVIFLHGVGGSGSVMAAIGRSWEASLTGTKFVAPNAPFARRSGGYQWFAIDDQVLRPDRIQAARQSFDALISGILKREGFENDLDKVAFVGVSQGAIMALDAVATERWRIGALVTFAGLLPLPPEATHGSVTSVLLLHGAADQTISSTASLAAARQLKAAGYDVAVKIFPGVGHTISSNEAQVALRFLRDHLDH